jgi:hypothetical protein
MKHAGPSPVDGVKRSTTQLVPRIPPRQIHGDCGAVVHGATSSLRES